MKDHEIAELHNDLRDTAVKYKDAEQLRARLASIVAPLVKKSKEYDNQNGILKYYGIKNKFLFLEQK